MQISRMTAWIVALTALIAALTPTAKADDRIRFSGFVTLNYYRADEVLDTISVDERGGFTSTLYALKIEMAATDELSLTTELWGDDAGNQTTSLEPDIIEAAGVWRPYHWGALRAGILKLPFGLYNEYRNVGIAYPTALLPVLYFENLGAMSINFRGVEVNLNTDLGDARLGIDAYYGETIMPTLLNESGGFAIDRVVDMQNFEVGPLRLRDLVGGRATLQDMLPGLELSYAAFVGWDYREESDEASRIQWSSWILSLRWYWNWLRITGEWTRQNNDNAGDSWYIQGGLWLWDQFEPFVLVDRFYADRNHRSTFYSRDLVLGARWQPLDLLTLKAEWHEIYSDSLDSKARFGQRDPHNPVHLYNLSVTVSYF